MEAHLIKQEQLKRNIGEKNATLQHMKKKKSITTEVFALINHFCVW